MFCCQNITKLFKWVVFCILVVLFINLYLLHYVTYGSLNQISIPVNSQLLTKKVSVKNVQKQEPTNTTLLASQKIIERLDFVNRFFETFEIPVLYNDQFHTLTVQKKISLGQDIWRIASKWVTKDHITPSYSPLLQSVLHHLTVSKITEADITSKGTQLKILLTLEGNQKALFKPKWYERTDVVQGSVYAGKDRHNGEIAAFHLARLLNLNRVPIVSGRVLNLRTEILPVATPALNSTFYQQGNNTCFYGVCMYCKRSDGVCGKEEKLEGSITLWLPEEWALKKARHPWQRSYSDSPAKWELYTDFCQFVRNSKYYKSEKQLLDLIETSIFDFLIDNGDRHHYEFFSVDDSKILLIDNAKSFGNPFVDHIDILAPLYQCCKIRRTFLAVLVSLQNGVLSFWLRKLLDNNHLSPVITENHLKALDRRLNQVLSAVMVCFEENGSNKVIVVHS